jgi:tetratricopeptide (TPR) repeat protein
MNRRTKKNRLRDTPNRGCHEKNSRQRRISAHSAAGLRDSYTQLAVGGLLLLAVALVFSQTVRFDFVNFDDNDYVYENLHIRKGPTWPGLVWAFSSFHASNWHPLTWLSHMLDIQLYGLWAGGHHLTNVLLHAASVIVLFLVLRRMTGRLWPSAGVAALFAIHPLHVESVAWVSERKDVLSGLFFALTLAAYLGYVRRPFSVLRYLLVVFCFALGLLSKPMLVTLPFALWLLDYWPLGRWKPFAGAVAATEGGFVPAFPRRVILEKVPLILLAAASCAVTMMAQTTAMAALEGIPWTTRAANAMVSYIVYLGQSLWPASLVAFYPYTRDALSWWTVAGSVILLASVSVVVVMWRRNRPYLLLGWLWYLGMLVPVIGLVQVGAQARADRYMYLPLIGPSLALAWASIELTGESLIRRRLCGMAWLLVLVALTAMASQQASYWRDSETLWKHALTATSRNWQAHNHLGCVLADRGRFGEALAHYEKSLEIQPNEAKTHYNLGNALSRYGQADRAIAQYQKALEIRPDYVNAHSNLGTALAGRGQFADAIAHYQKALEIAPDNAEVQNNLGGALLRHGQLAEAIAHYQKALEITPDNVNVRRNLVTALSARETILKSLAERQDALQVRPNDVALVNDTAWMLATNPNAFVRNGPGAVELAERAVKLSGGREAAILDTLAAAYAAAGQFDKAVETAIEAHRLAEAAGQRPHAEAIRMRLQLYRGRKPYHDPPGMPSNR